MGKTVAIDNTDTAFKYQDIDLSEYSDEELEALGIDPSDIEEDEEEEEDEEGDTEEGEEKDSEEEEDSVEEEEEEKQDRRKEPRIPKSRFDEAVQKEREKAIRAEERSKYLEEQIERLVALQQQVSEKETKAEPEFDFEDAEEKYAQLLVEGEIKEAAQLRAQINKEKDKWVQGLIKEIRKETLEEAEKNTKSLSEKEKKDIVVEQALIEYPFLDTEHEDYNEELVEEINALASGYQSKGKSPAEALQKALDRLAKPLVKKEGKKDITGKKKKVESMKKQPPKMETSSKIKDKTADDFDWEEMTQAEFEKILKENPAIVEEAMRKNYAV